MNAVIMNAGSVVLTARTLGILCRPTISTRLWDGEALEVTGGLFFRYNTADGSSIPYVLEPEELICEWELTTYDKLAKEYEAVCESNNIMSGKKPAF